MCGIFGVAGRPESIGLRHAAQTLKHRGPDGFGDWWSQRHGVYLAHCRLAIIDLSDAGRQPMENEDGTVRITFNGEIYNYQDLRLQLLAAGHVFRSHTDTEVIIHAYEQWGSKCVERLRGIFAFAIWDARKCCLFFARDRLGVKPLFYRIDGGEIAFGSEPRAILAIPAVRPSLDVSAAVQFLRYSFTTGTETIWRGINRIPPGFILEFNLAQATSRLTRYWSLPTETQSISWHDAVNEAEQLIADATTEQLVGDVPAGVFLSGGVDSSLVATFAARSSPAINSYCVDFSGWENSEVEDSRLVADHIGTTHHVCNLSTQACCFSDPDLEEEFFETWDEPIGDLATIPTWHISRLIRKQVTIALSGDGGDEVFAGYRRYADVQGSPRRRASWWFESIRRKLGVGRPWPDGCSNEFEYYHFLHCPSFTCAELASLFPDWTREILDVGVGSVSRRSVSEKDGPIRRWQRIDAHSYLVDNNLARVDRASMSQGLEVRVPLLDHRIVELAFSFPDEYGFRNGVQKPILREISDRHLPTSVSKKRKQGFSFPLDLFAPLEKMKASVEHGALVDHGLLNRAAFGLWCSRPDALYPFKLWLLYNLDQWAKHWLFRSQESKNDAFGDSFESILQ